MTETVVGLLRHGQTDWNIDFRLQGITDTPLNETGIRQAELAGRVISNQSWDVMLSSPLIRARDTAEIVAKLAGIEKFEILDLLLERSFGIAEGMRHEEWMASFARTGDHIPGSETLEQLAERSWLLLEHIATQFPGKRVLTVSHGALIRKVINLTSAGLLPREGERFGNASMSLIAHDGQKWKVLDYQPGTLTES